MADGNQDNNIGVLWAGIGRRTNPDGTTTIYCRQCQRPITRMARPSIRSVGKCALCIAREQGIPDPEKHILPSYIMTDPSQPPIPLEDGDPMEALYPEMSQAAAQGKIPPSGGMVGTAKSFFRAIVGWLGQEEDQKPQPAPLSKKISREKRSGGIFER